MTFWRASVYNYEIILPFKFRVQVISVSKDTTFRHLKFLSFRIFMFILNYKYPNNLIIYINKKLRTLRRFTVWRANLDFYTPCIKEQGVFAACCNQYDIYLHSLNM